MRGVKRVWGRCDQIDADTDATFKRRQPRPCRPR